MGGRLEPEQGQRFLGQEQVDVVVIGCGGEGHVDNSACRVDPGVQDMLRVGEQAGVSGK